MNGDGPLQPPPNPHQAPASIEVQTQQLQQQQQRVSILPTNENPPLNDMASRVLLVTVDWLRRCGPLYQLP